MILGYILALGFFSFFYSYCPQIWSFQNIPDFLNGLCQDFQIYYFPLSKYPFLLDQLSRFKSYSLHFGLFCVLLLSFLLYKELSLALDSFFKNQHHCVHYKCLFSNLRTLFSFLPTSYIPFLYSLFTDFKLFLLCSRGIFKCLVIF